MWSVGRLVAASIVLSVLVQQCACGVTIDDPDKKEVSPGEVMSAPQSADLGVQSAVVDSSSSVVSAGDVIASAGSSGRALETSEDDADFSEFESEGRQHGIKIKKKKKPKLKKAKKGLKKLLPFLMIPLLIQAKLLPLFIFKLKLLALKAFGIGKLALLLILGNIIYNAMHGAQNVDQQYNKEVLANDHYGYNGGPEIGAWINKRQYTLPNP